MKCWGEGRHGQLGQGAVDNIGDEAGEMGNNLRAIALGSGRTARSIVAGESHTCVLLDNASVKCWGLGSEGQLGQGAAANLGDGASELGDSLSAIEL